MAERALIDNALLDQVSEGALRAGFCEATN
jgi:hypothetical protein